MRSVLGCLVLLSATLAVIGAPVPKDKPKVKDEDAIIGTWKFEKFETGNAEDAPPAEEVAKAGIIFQKDGKAVFTGDTRGPREAGYKMDPSQNVKTMDVTIMDRQQLWIYELDGDTLKLGITKGKNSARPTEMKPNGKDVAVITLKRVTDEKKEAKDKK